jgi:hypothetical protein
MSRPLLLSYFEPQDLPTLLVAAESAGIPPATQIFVGSYGVSTAEADQVHGLAQGRYAPMFTLQPGWYWDERRLPADDDAFVASRPGGRKYAGALPAMRQLPALSATERLRWGSELGARFRDQVRAATNEGAEVDSWQFDEIVPACAKPSSSPLREFIRGILRGLAFGRSVLGDDRTQGFVWVANSALKVARLPATPELRWFWRTLDDASYRLVGEEYPPFDGDPRAAAERQAFGQRAFAAGGPVRRSLAAKYIPGLTPGYHLASGLGGNVHGWSRAQVNRWRADYLDARRRTGVAGFAAFDFRYGNSAKVVMQDVTRALGRGVAE